MLRTADVLLYVLRAVLKEGKMTRIKLTVLASDR